MNHHFLWKIKALWSSKNIGVGSLENIVEVKKKLRPNTVQIGDDIFAVLKRRYQDSPS